MAVRKVCGVYLIVSPSGRRYIGSSNDIRRRFSRYKNFAYEQQKILLNSIKKYGFCQHSFSVLFECEPSERLFWERIFGDMYLSLHDYGGLNACLPKTSDRPICFSKERKNEISIWSKRHQENPNTKIAQSELAKRIFGTSEARKENSERTKRRFSDPKERQAQSERTKKYQSTPEAREANRQVIIKRFSDPKKREEASFKTKEYLRNNPNALKKHSDRLKVFYKTNIHPQSKKVIDTETGEIFLSAKDLANRLGMPPHSIRARLNGKTPNKTSFKYLKAA